MTAALPLALASFTADVGRNKLFLAVEAKIRNPVSVRSRPRSEILLSAYVSLTCGRFESYLQEAFRLAAEDLRVRISKSNDQRIIKHDKFHRNNMQNFIAWSVGPGRYLGWADLEPRIVAFAQAISAGDIFPESFQYTKANPKADTVKSMFNDFGVESPFQKIAVKYIDSSGRKLNENLIRTKLDNFVKRRHQAAHNGRIPSMTRADAVDDSIFIVALAAAINEVLIGHLHLIV